MGMHAPWFQVRLEHWLVHAVLGSAASDYQETAFSSHSGGYCRQAQLQITAPMGRLGRDDANSGHTGSSGARCEVQTSHLVGSTARERRVLRSTTTGCAGKALKAHEILWAIVTRNNVTRLGGIKPLKG